IWPEDVAPSILETSSALTLTKGIRLDRIVTTKAFDPRDPSHWTTLALSLDERFLWLPWNWVTHKRALMSLPAAPVPPVGWCEPVLLDRHGVLDQTRLRASSTQPRAGVRIDSVASVSIAERFLVVNSGKPTDGLYSNVNRKLCRPAVRWLTHTPVTPNAV